MADEAKTDDPDDKPEGDGENDPSDGDAKDEKKDAGPPLYKRPLFWIVFLVVAAVLIVGGTLYWLHARQYVSTDDAFVDAHIVRLAPEVAGRLTQVAEVDNRHVRAGALLAVVEPESPAAQRAQAVAEVDQAIAGVRQAQAQVTAARATRAQRAADAVAPLADAVKAERDYARYRALQRLDQAAAAAAQVDQARANAERTAGQARAARRAVATEDANVRVARQQVAVSRAQVSAARARVAQNDVTIGNLHLRAPVAGQVVNRSVNVGSYVAPGQQIMALVPDRIWITANFKETQLARMRPGQPVDIKVDAFPDIAFVGHVDSIQRGAGQAFALLPAQNATGNYVKVVQRVPVRILFDIGGDRPDPRRWAIGPGMSVTPRVKVR